LQNNGIIASKIAIDINNKILHKQILKHIAPEFQLICETEIVLNKNEKTNKKYLQLI